MKKNYIPQPSGVYFRYEDLVQHSKNNSYDPSYQQAKEKKKSRDNINRYRKTLE